ncbi:carbohydrate sulfotransferase 1-like [Saccoglossus kowalevskii]|uniref:Carbohydrate sulfotransferase 1-like n=1 Tax=Saccoglossus kowalevskii TaxID=10224 RepID=A0ABM0N136_SACKO|nr:PREDICTED: carbohydrate sulfotransferase 1-like [Saccoglossus kowalevskii]
MRRPSSIKLFFYMCALLALSYVFSSTSPASDVADGMGREWNVTPIEEIEAKLSTETEITRKKNNVRYLPPRATGNERRTISTQNGTRVLIVSRFRTGSTITERFLSRNPDFFGVHEPGGMLQRALKKHILQDSYDKLSDIREDLLDFMHDIYNCNFTGHPYFIDSLNNIWYYVLRSYLTYLPRPNITNEAVTGICKSKPHKVIKVCRLYSILEAERLVTEDNVKIIFIVRDPRGMAPSRMKFTKLFTPEENFYEVEHREFKLHSKMEDLMLDYCNWLKLNHLAISELPDWLKDRYLIIRYEDMERQLRQTLQIIYNFVGVQFRNDVMRSVLQEVEEFEVFEKGNNGERWRNKLKIEEVLRVQELCSSKLFADFGYKLVNNQLELIDTKTSLVNDLPAY